MSGNINYPGDEPAKAFKATAELLRDLVLPATTYLGGKAEASKIISVANAEADAAAIKVRTHLRLEREAIEHQLNLEQIINKTASNLSFNHPKSLPLGSPPDRGWVSRFSEQAKHAYDDQVQNMWASLLAGEVTTPGRFSVRLMRTLSELRTTEAQNFGHLADYVWADLNGTHFFLSAPPKTRRLFAGRGVTDKMLENLDELGLISASPLQGFPSYTTKNIELLFHGRSYRLKEATRFECFTLSNLGVELLQLCKPEFDEEYLREVLTLLAPPPNESPSKNE